MVGLQALAKRDPAWVKQDFPQAGYANELVMFMVSTDSSLNLATGEVVASAFRKAGLNIDYRTMDFGTVVRRCLKPELAAQSDWSDYCSGASGLEEVIPPTYLTLRGNGVTGPNIGWPTSPETERLRGAWLDAQDLPSRMAIAGRLRSRCCRTCPSSRSASSCSPSFTTCRSSGC